SADIALLSRCGGVSIEPRVRAAPGNSESGRFLEESGDLGARFRRVSDQHMTAARIANEPGAGNVIGRVTRAVERAVQIVRHADRERGRGDFLQLAPRT